MKRTSPSSPIRLAATCLLAGALLSPSAFADTPDEQFQQAGELYRAKLFSTAAQELKAFLDANPNHPQAKVAAYQWAAALYRSNKSGKGVDYAAAAAAYEWALQKYPAAPPAMVSAARFELGEAYYFLDKSDKVVATLTDYLKNPGTGTDAEGRAAWANFYLGKSYAELGKPALARAAYEKVRDAYPNSDPAADALMELGVMGLDEGQPAAALKSFTAVREKYPTSEAAPEARVRQSAAYLAMGNWTAAREGYKAALLDPKAKDWKVDVLQGLADADFGEKKWADAANGYTTLLQALPANDGRQKNVQLQLASSLYNAKNWAQAVTAYTPLVGETKPEIGAPALYFRAGAFAAQGKFAEAAADYQKFLDSFSTNPLAAKAALRMGDAFAGAKNPGQAALAYKLVLTKYNGSEVTKDAQAALADLAGTAGAGDALESALRDLPAGAAGDAKLRLAQNAFQAKEWDKAIQMAQAVYDGKPDAATGERALYLIANSKLNAKDATAAAAFRKQLTTYPAGSLSGEGRLGLAWALEDAKQWPDAIVAAKAAAAGASAEMKPQAQLTLGGVLLNGGKYTEAAAAFAGVVTTDNAMAYQAARGAAMSLEKAGDWKGAAARWGTMAGLKSDPVSKAALLVRQGDDLRQARDTAGAQAAYTASLVVNPTGPATSKALYELAWIAQDAGQLDTAVSRWVQFVTNFPNDPAFGEANYQLGTALYKQQKWADAAPAFDRAGQAKDQANVPADAVFWSAESYRRAGNTAEAGTRYAAWVKATEAKTNASADVKAYLPAARLGWGATVTDPSAAVAIFQPAMANAQGAVKTELSYRLGRALAESGKWADAVRYLAPVAADDNTPAEWLSPAQWFAGQALENTDAKQDALEMYKKLAARQPADEWTAKAAARLKELGG